MRKDQTIFKAWDPLKGHTPHALALGTNFNLSVVSDNLKTEIRCSTEKNEGTLLLLGTERFNQNYQICM